MGGTGGKNQISIHIHVSEEGGEKVTVMVSPASNVPLKGTIVIPLPLPERERDEQVDDETPFAWAARDVSEKHVRTTSKTKQTLIILFMARLLMDQRITLAFIQGW
jgi:hypothetical protein